MAKSTAQQKAKAIQKKHGTSYYLATQFFPHHLREATYALYSFVRIPDQIVDEPANGGNGREELEAWIANWRRSMDGEDVGDPLIALATELFSQYKVPRAYGEDFLAAMLQDTEKDRYKNYAELEEYMYGSAAVVGLMMAHIIGTIPGADTQQVKVAATKLGEAMQLTNFLRDIDEDYQQRGRIYLPLDEMERFGVTEEAIAERKMSGNLKKLMQFQADRARKLYADAEVGLPLLQPEGRRAARLAAKLYAGILDAIKAQDYNPFAGRARTTKLKKITTILNHYWK